MRYRRLVNGEPSYGQGRADFLVDIYATAQAIETRLKLFTGEWWEDVYDGLPVWTDLLGFSGSDKNKSNSIISKRILETKLGKVQLVTGISNLTNTYDAYNRRFSYSVTAKSLYGYITVSNV